MQIFITGATGLVGRRIVIDRLGRGDRIIVLSRRGAEARRMFATEANPNVTVVEGNPVAPGAWQSSVDGCDAVIHLAGAGVAERRWSPAYREIMIRSRVDSTYQVAGAIRSATRPPSVLVSASAIGFYGDTGDTPVDEAGAVGDDFLAELSKAWEEQAAAAGSSATRVAILRVANVLDTRGGMLGKLLPIFRLGLGGPWGSGRQYLSWIHWRDLVGLVGFVLAHAEASGVYNAAAPNAVTVRRFAKTIGRTLGRPALLPVPGPVLRVAVGGLASAMTASCRAVPAKAEGEGYRFLFPEVDAALESLLKDEGDEAEAAKRPDAEAAVTTGDGAKPPAPIRLLALDVAGTLLRRDGSVPQGVIRACRSAERAGCVLVLATSRAPRGLHSVLPTLGLVGPTINYNGAVIWNPVEEQAQHHAALDGAMAREIAEEARALHPDLLVGVEILDRAYTDRVDHEFERLTGVIVEPDYIGPLDSAFASPVTRLDIAGPREQIDDVVALARDRYWRNGDVAVYRADAHVLQISHPLADKSIALQRIAAKLGVDKSQVMAVGAGENDTGMLEWAGFAVAVDNACPAARDLADCVVPNDDGLGVARAIRRFVL